MQRKEIIFKAIFFVMATPTSPEMLEAAADYIGREISERQFRAFFGGPSIAIGLCFHWIL